MRQSTVYSNVTRVDCQMFAGQFGQPGSMFPCFYSQSDSELVITELDSKEVTDSGVTDVMAEYFRFITPCYTA